MADNLDVIVRRARAATRGPWQLGDRAVNGEWWFGTVTDPDDVTEPGVPLGVCGTREDGDFVVHAREDILWLAEQVRDRDVALQAAEDRIAELEAVARTSVKGARCGADITHRDEGHRQSVCRLPVDHFDAHDDLNGCRWTDATTRHRPAGVTGDSVGGDLSGLSPEAAAAAVAATAASGPDSPARLTALQVL